MTGGKRAPQKDKDHLLQWEQLLTGVGAHLAFPQNATHQELREYSRQLIANVPGVQSSKEKYKLLKRALGTRGKRNEM